MYVYSGLGEYSCTCTYVLTYYTYVCMYVHVCTSNFDSSALPPSPSPSPSSLPLLPSLSPQLLLSLTTTQQHTPSANMPVCHQVRHLTLVPEAKTPQQLKKRYVCTYVCMYVCMHTHMELWKLCTHACVLLC